MPKTICSEHSRFNVSLSASQEKCQIGRKKKRIDKRRGHQVMMREQESKNKNLFLSRRKPRKTVYSPQYIIKIHEANTPLYHSDEYEPQLQAEQFKSSEPTKINSYITLEMLLRMYKEEQEEKTLLQKMRNFQITHKDEESSML